VEINQAGLDLIESFEGFSPVPYRDGAGNLTIGFGHLILPGETFTSLTREAALHLLYLDAQVAVNAVNNEVEVPLTQDQFNALVDFTYNLGVGAFESSTLLKLLNEGNYVAAADQFPLWDHAGGVVEPGLLVRREKEKALFLTGVNT